MAKKKNTDTNEENSMANVPAKLDTPEGFEDVSVEVEAFYDFRYTKEVFIKPLGVTVSDSKDKKKPSILIHAELMKDAELVSMAEDDDNGEDVVLKMFPAGTRIGLWYRPGLRSILQCADAVTYVALSGEKDVGQIQPMKTFKISRRKGAPAKQLACTADYRKVTRNMPLPWDAPSTKPKTSAAPMADIDDSDIPF